MKITEVQISFIKPNNGIIAFASLVLNNQLYLGSIAIHKKLNSEGYRITYPTKQGNKEFNIFHPVSRELGQAIEIAVINKLQDVMSKVNDVGYYGNHS